jgi:hypothetical protein
VQWLLHYQNISVEVLSICYFFISLQGKTYNGELEIVNVETINVRRAMVNGETINVRRAMVSGETINVRRAMVSGETINVRIGNGEW